MKRIVLLGLMMLPIYSWCQTPIFEENFDGNGPGISAWTLIDNDHLTPAADVAFVTSAWVTYDWAPEDEPENLCALSTSWYDPSGQADDWLISPPISLPEGTVYLNWIASSLNSSFPDGYQVWVSSTAGTTIADFDQMIFQISGENFGPTERNASLDAYAGTTIRFAFVNNSDDMVALAVDDIKVLAGIMPYECEVIAGVSAEPITYIQFGGMTNSSTPDSEEFYTSYLEDEALVVELEQGGTYPINLQGNSVGDYTNFFTVFIDWNQDGRYDAPNERYDVGSITDSNGADGIQALMDDESVPEIVVPENATLGSTTMRVVKYYDEMVESACSFVLDDWYGEVEDYRVTVTAMSAPGFNRDAFKAYPNPVKDKLELVYTSELSQMDVYNLVGQKIATQKISGTQSAVDLSFLSPGAYIVKVTAQDQSNTAIRILKK